VITAAGIVTGGPGGSPLVRKNGRPEHVRAATDASLRARAGVRSPGWPVSRMFSRGVAVVAEAGGAGDRVGSAGHDGGLARER
jgi:hypothetical protein